VQPKNQNFSLLVDTGSIVSVLPVNIVNTQQLNNHNKPLFAANGTTIKTYGTKNLDLTINERTYNWTFVIADITNPILGADFLSHYNFLIDCKNKKLYDRNFKTATNLIKNQNNSIGTIFIHKEQKTILLDNNNIISNKKTYSTFNKSQTNLQNTKTNKTNITNLYNKPTTKKQQIKINTTYSNNKTNTINTYNKTNKTFKIRTFYNSGKYTHRQILTLNDHITKQTNSQQKESNKKPHSSIKENNAKENETSSINII